MFANLSRTKDQETLRKYSMTSLGGLNLDRIRCVIEGGYKEDRDDAMLVRSIEQVVEYDPSLLREEDCKNHFLKYAVMQKTSAPVLRKILELWPPRDEWVLERAISDCEDLPALKQVLQAYVAAGGRAQHGAGTAAACIEKCAWPGCGKLGATQRCARCRSVQYCNKDHQKAHWSIHKIVCTDAHRHIVPGSTMESIQKTIHQASPGDVVEIPEGTYHADTTGPGIIEIPKPIRLIGAGMDKTLIHGDLKVMVPAPGDGGDHSNAVLAVCDLAVDGTVQVMETKYKQITFFSVEVRCPRDAASNAFEVNCHGKIRLTCCEIMGGSDGLVLSNHSTQASIVETDITFANNRGIFANPYFSIGPHSAVYNCGGYGIKGRSGWDDKGENEIQPGPWSPYGGAAY